MKKNRKRFAGIAAVLMLSLAGCAAKTDVAKTTAAVESTSDTVVESQEADVKDAVGGNYRLCG